MASVQAEPILYGRLSRDLCGNKWVAALKELQRNASVKEIPKYFKSYFYPHIIIQSKNGNCLLHLGLDSGVQPGSRANVESS